MATSSVTPSLNGAVTSLRTSTALLHSSISILSTGTSDLPRLAKVLTQTRHFELLPSSTLHAAQLALLDEITPEVSRLLQRVENEVERLERKEASLRARWELQEGRLGRETAAESAMAAKASSAMSRPVTGAKEEMKAKQIRSKKDRLSYAVERLQMQAQQIERNLRMSMAVQERAEAEEEKKAKGPTQEVDDDIEF